MSLVTSPGDKLYVGGVGSSTGPGVVRLNTDGSRDNSFAVGASGSATSSFYISKLLALPNNQLLAGGSFGNYNGTACSNLVRLNADGTVDTGYVPPVLGGNRIIQLARYANGRVLVAGGSTILVNGTYRGPIVRLNPNGSYDASFTTVTPVWSLTTLNLQFNEAILVSGSSILVNNQEQAPLVRFTAPNVLAISSHQSTARTEAWPSPAHEALQVSLDASAKPQQLTLIDALGKTVLTQSVVKTELA